MHRIMSVCMMGFDILHRDKGDKEGAATPTWNPSANVRNSCMEAVNAAHTQTHMHPHLHRDSRDKPEPDSGLKRSIQFTSILQLRVSMHPEVSSTSVHALIYSYRFQRVSG